MREQSGRTEAGNDRFAEMFPRCRNLHVFIRINFCLDYYLNEIPPVFARAIFENKAEEMFNETGDCCT